MAYVAVLCKLLFLTQSSTKHKNAAEMEFPLVQAIDVLNIQASYAGIHSTYLLVRNDNFVLRETGECLTHWDKMR